MCRWVPNAYKPRHLRNSFDSTPIFSKGEAQLPNGLQREWKVGKHGRRIASQPVSAIPFMLAQSGLWVVKSDMGMSSPHAHLHLAQHQALVFHNCSEALSGSLGKNKSERAWPVAGTRGSGLVCCLSLMHQDQISSDCIASSLAKLPGSCRGQRMTISSFWHRLFRSSATTAGLDTPASGALASSSFA